MSSSSSSPSDSSFVHLAGSEEPDKGLVKPVAVEDVVERPESADSMEDSMFLDVLDDARHMCAFYALKCCTRNTLDANGRKAAREAFSPFIDPALDGVSSVDYFHHISKSLANLPKIPKITTKAQAVEQGNAVPAGGEKSEEKLLEEDYFKATSEVEKMYYSTKEQCLKGLARDDGNVYLSYGFSEDEDESVEFRKNFFDDEPNPKSVIEMLTSMSAKIDKIFKSLEELKAKTRDTEKLRAQNIALKKKLYKLDPNARKDSIPAEEPIETAIQGTWKLVESKNVDEYLNMRRSKVMKNVIFRTSDHHFELKDGVLKMHQSIGPDKFFPTECKLNEPYVCRNVSSLSFIFDNALYTTDAKIDDGADVGREKRFVQDGRLHIVRCRNGVTCTRIYKKV